MKDIASGFTVLTLSAILLEVGHLARRSAIQAAISSSVWRVMEVPWMGGVGLSWGLDIEARREGVVRRGAWVEWMDGFFAR